MGGNIEASLCTVIKKTKASAVWVSHEKKKGCYEMYNDFFVVFTVHSIDVNKNVFLFNTRCNR